MNLQDMLFPDRELPSFEVDYYRIIGIPKFSSHTETTRALKKRGGRRKNHEQSKILKDAARLMKEPINKFAYDSHLYSQGESLDDYLNSIDDLKEHYHDRTYREFYLGLGFSAATGISCLGKAIFPYINSSYPQAGLLIEFYGTIPHEMIALFFLSSAALLTRAKESYEKKIEILREQIVLTDIIPLEKESRLMRFCLESIPRKAYAGLERFRSWFLGKDYIG